MLRQPLLVHPPDSFGVLCSHVRYRIVKYTIGSKSVTPRSVDANHWQVVLTALAYAEVPLEGFGSQADPATLEREPRHQTVACMISCLLRHNHSNGKAHGEERGELAVELVSQH